MKGLKAVSGILISNGMLAIDSADDSIHSDASIIINGGTFEIASGDDAVHADNTLTVTACNMTVSASYEGLEAEKIYIKGGTIVLNASDDGLNASGGTDASGTTGGRDGMFGGRMAPSSNGVIEISGGNLTIYASGDGLDSNGTLTISDGYIYVANPTSGDTSVIDSDVQPRHYRRDLCQYWSNDDDGTDLCLLFDARRHFMHDRQPDRRFYRNCEGQQRQRDPFL